MTKPIVLTLGEPAGIGPEVARSALRRFRKNYPGIEVKVLGGLEGVQPGKPTMASARSALAALNESARLALNGQAAAIVNAPVHKGQLKKIGFTFPGQTEFYASHFGLAGEDVTMIMASPEMTVGLVTTHCSLLSGVRRVNGARIEAAAQRLRDFLKWELGRPPRIAVAGLNPHAGEGGAFGMEEINIIEPAVRRLKRRWKGGIEGPLSPDTAYLACRQGKYDGVVSMYHDQGLIPFKLVAFDCGINVTAGLPIWRMSPDHGTAFDIAGKGQADDRSMYATLVQASVLSGTQEGKSS